MQSLNVLPIRIQKNSFTGVNNSLAKPLLPQNINNTEPQSQIKRYNLPPAYFHPSFGINLTKVKEFDTLMDFALAAPESVDEKLLRQLIVLLKATAALTPENLINRGRDANIYKLSDKFVIKTGLYERRAGTKGFQLCDSRFNKALDLYYGGKIAQTENLVILRNADPQKVAIPIGAPFNLFLINDIEEFYKRNNFAAKIAAMPQHSFDRIAMNYRKLNSFTTSDGRFYTFDYVNPNNFLLVGDEIKIVDDLETTLIKNPNNLSGLLDPFVNRLGAWNSATFDKSLVTERKIILKKCIMANEKAELPLESFTHCDFDNLDNALYLIRTKKIATEIVEKLLTLRENVPGLDSRLNVVKNYLDRL